jgi:tetratricopeptide (TPR) repeat protein/transcriptional regulator with XRE-family HTH domain
MADDSVSALAVLLRQLRQGARMTQEDLAEAARISVRTVSDMERGLTRTAHKESIRRLADALALSGAARETFEAVARGKGTEIARATRTLPRDTSSFTGRGPELLNLLESVAGGSSTVSIHAVGGMAGVGKTAFVVHAAHRLARDYPGGQILLSLNGHTPGQHPVEAADALAGLLQTAGVAAAQIPPDLEARARLWRNVTAGRKLLLVLDDALDSDQIRPLLPGTTGCLVLITSRTRLSALEDSQHISLDTLPLEEAGTLFARLTGRPDVPPDDPAVAEIAALCGYLPLALAVTAGHLRHHPAWSAADFAAELSSTRDRLALMSAEKMSVSAALQLSYAQLTPDQQRLFRRLGLHPGSAVEAYAAAALDDPGGASGLTAAKRNLEALYDRHLLTEPSKGRYRFHDLVREYARTLADGDPEGDREQAVARLLDYLLHTAQQADRQLSRRTPSAVYLGPAAPRHAPHFPTRAQAAAWMETERVNLQEASASTAASARPGYLPSLSAALNGFLRVQGYWDQAFALHEIAAQAAAAAEAPQAEADSLTDLAGILRLTGDYGAARGKLETAAAISRGSSNRRGEANALLEMGNVQYPAGDYAAATATFGQALRLYRDLGDRLGEATVLNNLGAVQALTGEYPAAAQTLTSALRIFRALGDQQGQATVLYYLGTVQRLIGQYKAALASETEALDLYGQLGDRRGQASALNDLGAVQRLTGDYGSSVASQTEALRLFRELGHRLGQASALGDLGALHLLTGDNGAAIDSLTQALDLFTELEHPQGQANTLGDLGAVQTRVGSLSEAGASLGKALTIYTVLDHSQGQAEILNYRGELELAWSRVPDALASHQQALNIATDISSLAEEGSALEGLGRCYQARGDRERGTDYLRRALVLYRRIHSAHADRVDALLREEYH